MYTKLHLLIATAQEVEETDEKTNNTEAFVALDYSCLETISSPQENIRLPR